MTNDLITMTMKTEVCKIGNSLGIVLPKEALQILNVEEGATLHLTAAPENSLRIVANYPNSTKMMQIAESCMQRYGNALKELAK